MRRVASSLALLVVLAAVATPAAAVFVEQPADLAVEQPHYVDGGVDTSETDNITTYRTRGGELDIRPRNFNQSAVVEAGVASGDGSLSYDDAMGTYEFEPAAEGTHTLYWIAEEQRVVNNSTRDVEVRYVARINASAIDRAHVAPGALDQQREDAANWSAWVESVRSSRVAGPEADMETQTQLALDLLRLRHHPLSALTGQFTALLLTLFITLSGLVIVAMAVGAHLWSRRKDILEQRRRRKMDAERATLEDELDAYEETRRTAALEGMDWNDLFDDTTARVFRDHLGETPLDGWLQLQALLAPKRLVRERLNAMADTHVAVFDDPDARTDGGEAAGGANATLEPRVNAPATDDPRVRTLDDPDDDLLDAVDWDDPELREFDLAAAVADQDDEADDLLFHDVESLAAAVDLDWQQEFGSKEVFAEYLTEFLRAVVEHPYSDGEGRPRPVRHLLNLWLRVFRHVGEREGVPAARYSADHVHAVLRTYDREEEIASWVDDVEMGLEGSAADVEVDIDEWDWFSGDDDGDDDGDGAPGGAA